MSLAVFLLLGIPMFIIGILVGIIHDDWILGGIAIALGAIPTFLFVVFLIGAIIEHFDQKRLKNEK